MGEFLQLLAILVGIAIASFLVYTTAITLWADGIKPLYQHFTQGAEENAEGFSESESF